MSVSEDYKTKLNAMVPELDVLRGAMKLDDAKAEIADLEKQSESDGFWNDVQNAQKVQQRMKQLQNKCAKFDKLLTRHGDLIALCEMAQEEEDAQYDIDYDEYEEYYEE